MTTFADVLASRLRRDPGRPLVTFYDGATGERVELSVATYANWVAKAASLLVEELDAERGESVRVDLPAHWLGPVALGAAWRTGLVVTDSGDPDLVVCGPAGLPAWADRAHEVRVVACSLLPMGVRFPDGVPDGVVDLGVDVWSQPDDFVPWDPPTDDDVAVTWGERARTHAQLWEDAATGTLLTEGGRLLSAADPASASGLATWCEPLARGGSLILCTGVDDDQLDAIYATEHATARVAPN